MLFVELLVLACFIAYTQGLHAQKCHRNYVFDAFTESCAAALVEARCVEGVISVQSIKYSERNRNFVSVETCCYDTDGYANGDIRAKVMHECERQRSCKFESIRSGTVLVEYTCVVTRPTSSPTYKPTNNLRSTTVPTSLSTSMTIPTEPDTVIAASTDQDTLMKTTGPSKEIPSSSTPTTTSVVPTIILVAVAVVVTCLASVLASVVCLRRRYRARTQETAKADTSGDVGSKGSEPEAIHKHVDACNSSEEYVDQMTTSRHKTVLDRVHADGEHVGSESGHNN